MPETPSVVVVSSPNAPRPADPEIVHVADTLRRIEGNYGREGSGPGSRFEGRLLEDVQAEAVVRMVREACAQLVLSDEAITAAATASDEWFGKDGDLTVSISEMSKAQARVELAVVAGLIRARQP